MLGDSSITNRIMIMHLKTDGKIEHSYILSKRKKKEEKFQDEQMINQAYQQGAVVEITISNEDNHPPKTIKGRIFHIDRRNHKIILIDDTNEKTRLSTPIPFVTILNAKIIPTK